MELKDTVKGMISADYKERMAAEYHQVKIRHDKLEASCDKIEAAQITGGPPPKHDCPLGMLREQQHIMESYLHTLRLRAVIEGVQL